MPLSGLQFPPTSWPGGRYSFLLAALVLMFAVDPLVDSNLIGRIVLDAFTILIFLSGALSIGNRRIAFAIVICLLAPEILGMVLGWFDTQGSLGNGLGGVIRVLAAIALCAYLTVTIFLDLFRADHVSGDAICAALCVYLMLGLLWAFAYMLIAHWVPDSFKVGEELVAVTSADDAHDVFSLLIYFSFVTLTTLGFGDVTPISPVARTACWLEAITGQIFLATFVAGLVGVHIAKRMERHRSRQE